MCQKKRNGVIPMAEFNLLLDTNIFIKNKYGFSSGSLFNLKKHCDDGVATMYTNDIILREVRRHIKSDVGLLAAQAKNAIKDHKELVNAITPEAFEEVKKMLLSAPDNLRATFDSYMQDAVQLSNEKLSIIDLLNDYFAPNSPFEGNKEKRSEFPDATIIMSIKRYIALMGGEALHVVTDDNGWHNALKDTVGIVMHKEVKTLLTAISQKQEGLFKKITAYVGTQLEVLQTQSEMWLIDQSWDFVVDEIDTCVECDAIDEIKVKSINPILDSIEYIDAREGNAVVTLSDVASIKINFSYVDHTEEIYDKEDGVWYNTIYGNGDAEIAVPFSLSVMVLFTDGADGEFDLDAPDFDELDKSNIVILNHELAEQNDYISDPYYDICPDCGGKIGLHNDGGNGFCIKCASAH